MYVIFAYLYLFSCSFLFSTMNCCHCAGVLGVSLFETLVLSLVYFLYRTFIHQGHGNNYSCLTFTFALLSALLYRFMIKIACV